MRALRTVVVALACMAFVGVAHAQGFVIEMEEPDARFPDDGSFAEPAQEGEGSMGRVLFKFYVDGHVLYRFEVERKAVYTGWLRYGSKGEIPLRVAVDPADETAPEFESATLPPTGGYIGPGVWGWAQIFRQELAAGEHVLAIGSAAFRPDCIYVTSGDETPTDDLVKNDWREILGDEAYERALEPIYEVHPDWLDEVEAYEPPDWYEQTRVQLHTRLSLRWLNEPVFLNAAQAFRRMGARAFVRHIKSGAEGAWWASAVGPVVPEAEGRNIAQEIIDSAHEAGCHIIVYHRHMEDDWVAEQHPDWAARDNHGMILLGRRHKICFNSPYTDYVQTRLLELVEMGADGFYFDEVHMPKQCCWCGYCREAFTELTGFEHPEWPDPHNPVWHRLKDFNNLTIERIFRQWRPAIHERNPECVMLVGSNTWPTMMDRHMTNRLFRIADVMKTEFSLPNRMNGRMLRLPAEMAPTEPDIKIALGYALARDACDGRPPHIWTHGLLDETSALYASAGMMTHGCVANLDVSERNIPDMKFASALALGDRVSPHFARMRPIGWAAIHYSELAKDRRALDPAEAWREVLHPIYGAYMALFGQRLPVRILTDSQLCEPLPQSCRVLFVPAPEDLTDRMRGVIEQFRAAGGTVIENRDEWLWHEPDGRQAAIDAFLAELPDDPPVQVTGGPELMHAEAFASEDGERLTVSLANRFSWVYTGRRPDPERLEELTTPPPPCEGVTVLLRGLEAPPASVREVVRGRDLAVRRVGDHVEVDVPGFEYMAVLAVGG